MNIKKDHIGIILSCTCIIHCMLFPFILVGLTFFSNDELFHAIFLIAALAATGHAMYHSYKKHCKHIVIFFGCIGLFFLGIDLVLPHHKEETLHVELFPIIGSIFLIATHTINLYYDKIRHREFGDCCK